MTVAVNAVVWDVGKVLVEWDLREIYRGQFDDPAMVDWFVANIVTEQWHFRHDAGEPIDSLVAARKAEFPEYADLIERYRTHWLDSLPGPVPGTHALIERLSARHVPQFAITNFGADTWAMFRPTFPILDHVCDVVVSGIEKLAKPDPAIFALAAARFGHAPQQMLFVDDNAANIAAARESGWQTHHFVNGAAALEADLAAHGLI
jgi:2-haloacid dehalogenase